MAQISQDELRTLAFCDCWHDFGTHFKQMKEYEEKEKVTTEAMDEFLEGKVQWHVLEDIQQDQ